MEGKESVESSHGVGRGQHTELTVEESTEVDGRAVLGFVMVKDVRCRFRVGGGASPPAVEKLLTQIVHKKGRMTRVRTTLYSGPRHTIFQVRARNADAMGVT